MIAPSFGNAMPSRPPQIRSRSVPDHARRCLSVGIVALALTLSPPAVADSVKLLVQSSPLAGSQYYALAAVWSELRIGDRLTLAREPNNPRDRQAVRVDWFGHKLGYVPRAENAAVARALDDGEQLEARVSRRRDDADPWQRVEFEVYLIL